MQLALAALLAALAALAAVAHADYTARFVLDHDFNDATLLGGAQLLAASVKANITTALGILDSEVTNVTVEESGASLVQVNATFVQATNVYALRDLVFASAFNVTHNSITLPALPSSFVLPLSLTETNSPSSSSSIAIAAGAGAGGGILLLLLLFLLVRRRSDRGHTTRASKASIASGQQQQKGKSPNKRQISLSPMTLDQVEVPKHLWERPSKNQLFENGGDGKKNPLFQGRGSRGSVAEDGIATELMTSQDGPNVERSKFDTLKTKIVGMVRSSSKDITPPERVLILQPSGDIILPASMQHLAVPEKRNSRPQSPLASKSVSASSSRPNSETEKSPSAASLNPPVVLASIPEAAKESTLPRPRPTPSHPPPAYVHPPRMEPKDGGYEEVTTPASEGQDMYFGVQMPREDTYGSMQGRRESAGGNYIGLTGGSGNDAYIGIAGPDEGTYMEALASNPAAAGNNSLPAPSYIIARTASSRAKDSHDRNPQPYMQTDLAKAASESLYNYVVVDKPKKTDAESNYVTATAPPADRPSIDMSQTNSTNLAASLAAAIAGSVGSADADPNAQYSLPSTTNGRASPRPNRPAPAMRAAAAMSILDENNEYVPKTKRPDAWGQVGTYETCSILSPSNGLPSSRKDLLSKIPLKISLKNVKLEDIINQGTFGTTSKAEIKIDAKKKVSAAVTVLSDSNESNQVFALQSALLLSRFNHDNVLKLIGVVSEGATTIIASELCMQGSLEAHLQKESLTISAQLKFAAEIASGMSHIAAQNVVHRDIRSRNILLQGTTCKVADFGFSRDAAGPSASPEANRWMAPEAATPKREFTFASDVWSFGVLLFELFTEAQIPYSHMAWDSQRVIAEVTNGFRLPRPKTCPGAVFDLMGLIWSQDAKKRPTFSAILDRLRAIDSDSALRTRKTSVDCGLKDASWMAAASSKNASKSSLLSSDEWDDLARRGSDELSKPLDDKPGLASRQSYASLNSVNLPDLDAVPEAVRELGNLAKATEAKPKPTLETQKSAYLPMKLSTPSMPAIDRTTKPKQKSKMALPPPPGYEDMTRANGPIKYEELKPETDKHKYEEMSVETAKKHKYEEMSVETARKHKYEEMSVETARKHKYEEMKAGGNSFEDAEGEDGNYEAAVSMNDQYGTMPKSQGKNYEEIKGRPEDDEEVKPYAEMKGKADEDEDEVKPYAEMKGRADEDDEEVKPYAEMKGKADDEEEEIAPYAEMSGRTDDSEDPKPYVVVDLKKIAGAEAATTPSDTYEMPVPASDTYEAPVACSPTYGTAPVPPSRSISPTPDSKQAKPPAVLQANTNMYTARAPAPLPPGAVIPPVPPGMGGPLGTVSMGGPIGVGLMDNSAPVAPPRKNRPSEEKVLEEETKAEENPYLTPRALLDPEWLHGQISRDEAMDLLRDGTKGGGVAGAFLFRRKGQGANSYAITILTDVDKVDHFMLEFDGYLGWYLNGNKDKSCGIAGDELADVVKTLSDPKGKWRLNMKHPVTCREKRVTE